MHLNRNINDACSYEHNFCFNVALTNVHVFFLTFIELG